LLVWCCRRTFNVDWWAYAFTVVVVNTVCCATINHMIFHWYHLSFFVVLLNVSNIIVPRNINNILSMTG
jgi:hypothetical protein